MKRLVALVLAGLIVVSLALTQAPARQVRAAAGGNPSHAAMSPEHTILIGLGQFEVSQGDGLSYTPTYLDVTVGDRVLWRDIDALDPHTVSFGPLALLRDLARKDQFITIPQKAGPPTLVFNPKVAFRTPRTTYDGTGYANSGILQHGKTWSLTFTTPGTYEYICLIHDVIMRGYVVVHPVQPPSSLSIVQAGDGPRAASDKGNTTANQAFYPYALTIHVGETVQWIGAFHTISFGPEALLTQLQRNVTIPVPQKNGPPLLAFNPKIAWPSGGTTYNGRGFVNSGVLVLNTPPGSKAPPSFKLTFTKAGTYKYYCLIHPGMDGTITVLP